MVRAFRKNAKKDMELAQAQTLQLALANLNRKQLPQTQIEGQVKIVKNQTFLKYLIEMEDKFYMNFIKKKVNPTELSNNDLEKFISIIIGKNLMISVFRGQGFENIRIQYQISIQQLRLFSPFRCRTINFTLSIMNSKKKNSNSQKFFAHLGRSQGAQAPLYTPAFYVKQNHFSTFFHLTHPPSSAGQPNPLCHWRQKGRIERK
ncbi:unnamed protein product (macronuclear) [Paramecium tetraurelia]|uniref:Uncharacterized protein n=1 Tax=Paramecium tetraurelia TaxID=5888 RepID=A0C5X8_PARTE|nr:uncharacterized protein GSPATT00035324001 [Paramecium tetraurelia]CAK66195.1 unnamed protein product [Paramecium tetraurelia]|eukprot:XP_001433592.1 hypothetical protein (macronuclear) [Paramecium tetraurelia strain d4-2]